MKKGVLFLLSAALILSVCFVSAIASGIPQELSPICSAEEWEILKLTNQQRLAEGLIPYSTFSGLQTAADIREKELVSSYSHTRPNGESCFTALTQSGLGYSSAAENIAAGQTSPSMAISAWMGSDGHRKNILDESFMHVGSGYTPDNCRIVTQSGSGLIKNGWVQLFLTDRCTITSIKLSSESASLPVGGILDELDLSVTAICSTHGNCYLPLLSGMCSGFDSNTQGSQTVTVSYAGQQTTLQLYVGESLDTTGADQWAVDWLNRANTLSLLSDRNRAGFTANVSRLQFADLAVRLAEQLTGVSIVPAPAETFTDTTEEIILKAKAAGIASGYASGDSFEFRPANPITRQEICVMLSNVISYVNQHRSSSPSLDLTPTIQGSFPDTDRVASWAVKQVAWMTNNKVMGGKAAATGPMLCPEDNTSLQEAVTLTVKLFDLYQ